MSGLPSAPVQSGSWLSTINHGSRSSVSSVTDDLVSGHMQLPKLRNIERDPRRVVFEAPRDRVFLNPYAVLHRGSIEPRTVNCSTA